MWYGLAIAILTGIAQALYGTFCEKSSLLIIQLRAALPHICVILYLLFFGKQNIIQEFILVKSMWWLFLIDFIICLGLTVTWFLSTKSNSVVISSIWDITYPLFLIPIWSLIFKHPINWQTFLGGAFVALGIYIVNMSNKLDF